MIYFRMVWRQIVLLIYYGGAGMGSQFYVLHIDVKEYEHTSFHMYHSKGSYK